MSMLAERKVKQKWCLNPRGKAWSEDSNKFGQKLMEKMGWSHGKGLGAKENGVTEHVKVSYKNDSKGMGFKESNDQWTENSDSFNDLLQKLSENNPEDDRSGDCMDLKLASLEKKSQSSKVRVHYHKFTRGKDLSRYSQKDLANIFGKKKLEKDEPLSVDENDTRKETVEEEEKKSSFIVNGGSMLDYFKKKLPRSFGQAHGYVIGNNGVLKKPDQDEDSESEVARVGFGFSRKRNFDSSEENDTPSKKKKSGVEIGGFSNPAFNPMSTDVKVERHNLNPISEADEENVDKEEEVTEIHQKKKKKERKISRSSLETVQEMIEEQPPTPKKKKSKVNLEANLTETPNEEIRKKIRKKDRNEDNIQVNNNAGEDFEVKRKNKKKRCEILAADNPNFDISAEDGSTTISGDNFEVKRKDKIKTPIDNPVFNESGDAIKGFSNPAFNPMSTDVQVERHNLNPISEAVEEENVDKEEICKKKKKEQKLSRSSLEKVQELIEEHPPTPKKKKSKINLETPNAEETKKKIKKKDRSEDSVEVDNTVKDFEVKRKEKKKRPEVSADNPSFDISAEGGSTSVCNGDFEVKRKNKSKTPIDNPIFDESAEDLSLTNAEYEVKRKKSKKSRDKDVKEDFEVKRKQKKKRPEVSTDNPSFDISTEDGSTAMSNDTFEVKRKNKSKNPIENPIFDESGVDSSITNAEYEVKRKKSKKTREIARENPEPSESPANNRESGNVTPRENGVGDVTLPENGVDDVTMGELMLNVTNTPVMTSQSGRSLPSSLKTSRRQLSARRKSVRFSDVNEERVIPYVDCQNGVDAVRSMSDRIDGFQAEIENDLNEEKLNCVGQVGTPDGDNELLPDGSTRLKLKFARFEKKTPSWMLRTKTGPKASIKHLIKGDIILDFKNANLHKVDGYAYKK